jgi:hypothetical protein
MVPGTAPRDDRHHLIERIQHTVIVTDYVAVVVIWGLLGTRTAPLYTPSWALSCASWGPDQGVTVVDLDLVPSAE